MQVFLAQGAELADAEAAGVEQLEDGVVAQGQARRPRDASAATAVRSSISATSFSASDLGRIFQAEGVSMFSVGS